MSFPINETFFPAIPAVEPTAFGLDALPVESQYEEESFTARHVALAVIPHVTGFTSLVGSSWIAFDVIRQRCPSVYHRLLLGLAVSDIIASVGFFLSTWPIPEESNHAWGAIGNIQTCEFQGFLVQLGLATCLYNAFLSVYYVLLVRFNFKKESKQMLCLEQVAHTAALVLALGTAIASLVLNLYNDANLWCWIAPHPLDCENSITAEDGVGTCVRGNNAWVYRMAFYFSWLWMSFAVVVVSMAILTYTVRQQWQKMDRYRYPAASGSSNSTMTPTTTIKTTPKKSKKKSSPADNKMRSVMIQSLLYIAAFLVTALPVSIARVVQAKYNCTSTFFPLSLTTVMVFPLQGFWNALIYFRPKYLKWRVQKRREGLLRIATSGTTTTVSQVQPPSTFHQQQDQQQGVSKTSSELTTASQQQSQQQPPFIEEEQEEDDTTAQQDISDKSPADDKGETSFWRGPQEK